MSNPKEKGVLLLVAIQLGSKSQSCNWKGSLMVHSGLAREMDKEEGTGLEMGTGEGL